VFIGEKHYDSMAEVRAEKQLGQLFPLVALVTTPEGAKLIPVQEVHKMAEKHRADLQKANKEGYEHGHRIGLEKGLDEARKVLSQFEQAIQDAVTQRIELLEEAKQKILELVLQISKKVTFDALEVDPDTTLGMIEGVINQLVDRSRLRIKVNPDHLPIVEQHMDRFLRSSTTIKDLTFEADPRVRVGGCFIETPTGDIDARLSSQFEVIGDALSSSPEKS
jgi:flagellar biosynthesis/type III secretory pathway protein FliH